MRNSFYDDEDIMTDSFFISKKSQQTVNKIICSLSTSSIEKAYLMYNASKIDVAPLDFIIDMHDRKILEKKRYLKGQQARTNVLLKKSKRSFNKKKRRNRLVWDIDNIIK